MKRHSLVLLLALIAGISLFVYVQSPDEIPPAGQASLQDASPLRTLVPSWNAEQIRERCDAALRDARAAADAMAGSDTAENLLRTWDHNAASVEDMLGPVYLLAYTHIDPNARDAGQACIVETTNLQTELFQNPRLFELVSTVAARDTIDAKLKDDLIKQFEDTGVSLPEGRRKRASEIIQAITERAQEFQKTLRENKEKLRFGPEEQKGLPDSYLGRIEKDGDEIIVGFDYPEAYPFLTYAENAAARERMYRGFLNRGGEGNLVLLEEIAKLRKELAALYDLPSYAHYVTRRYMSGSPDAVHQFLDEVAGKVREVEQEDIDMLRDEKAAHLGIDTASASLDPWDKQYYLERLRKSRFNVDQEALRKYFPTLETVNWALATTGNLYGIHFEYQEGIKSWDPDIRYYDVHDTQSGRFIGGLYLDLFPREGKYGHAAAFPIRGSSTLLGRHPATALVTNFDRTGLTQREVETLLHELGHAVHGVLSNTRYVSQAGTSVERDFVEAPSQMYEEWARRLETLQRMQEFCADCPLLDADTVERIEAARLLGKGLHYGRQLLYARFDMALAGEKVLHPQEEWVRMESQTPMGHAEGTQFPGTFGHIAGGYAAGYYGYMWSETLAMDFVSVFGDQLMNPEIGHRFRDRVLSRGSEVAASDMARAFLGREPSPDAFFREISGE